MNEIPNDLKCMTFSKNDISRIENEAYNKALEDFANELKWLFSMYYTGSLNSKDIDDIVKELRKGIEE